MGWNAPCTTHMQYNKQSQIANEIRFERVSHIHSRMYLSRLTNLLVVDADARVCVRHTPPCSIDEVGGVDRDAENNFNGPFMNIRIQTSLCTCIYRHM